MKWRCIVVGVLMGMFGGLHALWAVDLNATWKDGLRFESEDKAFQVKIGGRIHNDWAFFIQDAPVRAAGFALTDGTQFRTARLYLSSVMYDRIGFKAQYDFAAGEGSFKDVYMEFLRIPVVGTVRIGQFKEPFSIDQLTSSNHIMFLERSVADALAPGRSTGLMLTSPLFAQRMTYSVGVFRDTDAFGDGQGDGDYNITARLTGLPWYADEGRRLIHVGAAFRHSNPNGDIARFRTRPEARLAPVLIDTGNFISDAAQQFGGEAALVWGPFSIQGEYLYGLNSIPAAPKANFSAYYAQASYFVTGEHRAYKVDEAAFGRVAPRRNLFQGGPGAFELAARFSNADLADAGAGVAGGTLRDITGGVNWYLNPNMRIMLNYVNSKLAGTGSANIVQSRFQVDF